jgi:hypothetical protein
MVVLEGHPTTDIGCLSAIDTLEAGHAQSDVDGPLDQPAGHQQLRDVLFRAESGQYPDGDRAGRNAWRCSG